jgi:MFS family permease
MAESTATRARPRRGALGVLRDGATAADATPYGWAPAVVIFLVGLVDRVEFSLVSAVLPQLQEEWGFGDSVAGSIPTASAVAAGLLALPAGYIADRWDRTRIVAIVVLLWALTTLGSGLVTGFAMFYLLRVLLAAAESIDNPATGSLLADYYPPVTRATAYGWWRTSAYLGGLGLVIGGVLAELFGWRAVFVVMSVPGLVVAWLMWRLQEPERGYVDRLQAAAAQSGVAGADPAGSTGVSDVTRVGGGPEADPAVDLADVARVDVPALREQVRAVLRIRTLWFTGFSLTVMSMALAGLYYWMPSLMQRRFDLGEAAAGGISGLVSLVGVVGGTVVGSRLGQRPRGSLGLAPWRVLVGGAGILLNGMLMAGALAMPGVAAFSLLVFLSAFFGAFAIPTLTACVADVIPARDRGVGFGVLQVAATAGMALGPLVVGIVSDVTDSLLTGMACLVPLILVAGVSALACRPWVERDAAAVLTAARS